MTSQLPFLIFFAFLILMAIVLVAISMAYRYKKREMEHRERMIAFEKGTSLPAEQTFARHAPWSPRAYLLRGLIWTFTGIALTIFLLGLSISTHHEATLLERVDRASVAKASGATNDQVQQIMNDKEPQGLPVGVALIGLIPIGLGVAFLVAYRAEKAHS